MTDNAKILNSIVDIVTEIKSTIRGERMEVTIKYLNPNDDGSFKHHCFFCYPKPSADYKVIESDLIQRCLEDITRIFKERQPA